MRAPRPGSSQLSCHNQTEPGVGDLGAERFGLRASSVVALLFRQIIKCLSFAPLAAAASAMLEEAAAILGTSVETIERKAERLGIRLKGKRPSAT
jgi:hypothetical protein